MSVVAMQDTVDPRPFTAPLLPIMGVVFVGFLVIGVAMPVLPLYVHDGLGFGTFVVGLVAGSQFAASLISRPWAGHYSDGHGAKRAVVPGSARGLRVRIALPLLAPAPDLDPEASVTILLLGRAVLGGAESFIITAAVSWGLAIVDRRKTGKVIAWVGSAMFAAFAIGAPVGSALYAGYGFPSDCARHCTGTVGAAAARCTASRCRAGAACSPSFTKVLAGVGTGFRLGIGQRGVRRCDHVRRAAVRRSRLGARMARLHRLRRRIHPRARLLQPCSRQVWRRQGRAVLRADRNCRPGC